MEARIYAEDPLRGFLPSIGPLLQYHEPPSQIPIGEGMTKIRVDSGVTEGSEISVHYDPMISKLIAYSDNRNRVIDGLVQALDRYVIEGVQHNAQFLQALLHQEAFREGSTPTNFIPTHYPKGFSGIELNEEEKSRLAAVMVLLSHKRRSLLNQPPLPMEHVVDDGQGALLPEDVNPAAISEPIPFNQYCTLREQPHVSTFVVSLGGLFGKHGIYEVSVNRNTGQFLVCNIKGASSVTDGNEQGIFHFKVKEFIYHPSTPIAELKFTDEMTQAVQFHSEDNSGIMRIQVHGALHEVMVMSPKEYELSQWMHEPPKIDVSSLLQSPMPGTLISVAVKEGQEVQQGQELCVVEAMKMQNILRSSKHGKISKIKVKVGASLKVNETILEFEADEQEETG